MQDKNNNENFNADSGSGGTNDMANKNRGPQGVDKAPGEETAQSTEDVVPETQKGKKVDADPSQSSDRPVKEEG